MPRVLSESEKKLLAAASLLVDKGENMREVAESCGIDYCQLQGWRKKAKKVVSQRNVFTIIEKIDAVKRVVGGEHIEDVASSVGAALITMQRWVRAFNDGRLSLENAIACRTPKATPEVETYHIAGKSFRTLEECTKFAVEAMGGITQSRTVTVKIKL